MSVGTPGKTRGNTRRRVTGAQWPSRAPSGATLVFDGWCGFCTRSVRLLEALDRRHRLRVVAAQQPGVADSLGLTPEETAAAAWVLTPDGSRCAGARAIATAVAVALGTRLPLVAWMVPGFGPLADRVYAWIADNRRRLRGDQPWCARHPERCQSRGVSCGSKH